MRSRQLRKVLTYNPCIRFSNTANLQRNTMRGVSMRQVAALMWFTIVMGSGEGQTDLWLFTHLSQY
jgi:hypothetical protein